MRSLRALFSKNRNHNFECSLRRYRPALDALEQRQLPSTSPLTVTMPEVSLRPGQQRVVELPAGDATGNALSYAVADPGLVQKAFELDQRLGLSFTGNYYTNWLGGGEKWVQGITGRWYYVRPNGELWEWNGATAGNAGRAPDGRIDTLDPSFHADPRKLFEAPQPAVSASISGRQLTIRTAATTSGDFPVNLAISSTGTTVSRTVQVHVGNQAPTLAAIDVQQIRARRPVQTGTLAESGLTLALTGRDVDGDAVVYGARLAGASARAHALDQQLGLRFSGSYSTNWLGAGEKWLLGNYNQWYFLTPDGSLYRWTGIKAAPAQAGTLMGTLDPSYHAEPKLLYEAPAPPAQVSVSGGQLTITPAAGFVGDLAVEVSASDGLATATRNFVVQVVNTAPTLDLADQHLTSGTTRVVALPIIDADGDAVTYAARLVGLAARAWELDQQLDLRFSGSYATN